jgi:hypothetical protein
MSEVPGGVPGYHRGQLEDVVDKMRADAAAEQAAPLEPETANAACKGCGRAMTVIEAPIPRAINPPGGLKIRSIATGTAEWYCSETCFKDHR